MELTARFTDIQYAHELRRAIQEERAREAEERRLMGMEEIRSAVPQVGGWLVNCYG